MYKHFQKIHFVGIGGIGMSGIAEVLMNLGYRVSGSDLCLSPLIDRLRHKGAIVRIGHRASNVKGSDVVVTSSAVSPKNPEVVEAHRDGIPVIARAEMLAELMRLKYGVAIAGSHGKTSTTSLVASVLSEGGLDPTMVVGGRLRSLGSRSLGSMSLGSNARLGKGDFLVAEADESDGSFMHLNPTIAVITNIDPEHLDHYGNFAELRETFARFAEKIPFYGVAIFCEDHPVVAALARNFRKRSLTYGLNGGDLTATGIRPFGIGSRYSVHFRGKRLGEVTLAMLPGRHNVANSLAAVAVAQELGIPFAAVQRAFRNFKGISRRFEVIHDQSVTIVDDYGHHPAEIRATLAAARSLWKKRRIWVLFQPHRYTRTKILLNDFSKAFGDADQILTTEIYPAGERPIRGVDGRMLARKIRGARFCADKNSMLTILRCELKRGDVVITLGAGDIWKVGRELANECFD